MYVVFFVYRILFISGRKKMNELMEIFLFLKAYIFVFSLMVVFVDIIYVVSTLILKSGKLIPSISSLIYFGLSLAYIITYLIY